MFMDCNPIATLDSRRIERTRRTYRLDIEEFTRKSVMWAPCPYAEPRAYSKRHGTRGPDAYLSEYATTHGIGRLSHGEVYRIQ